eukprot:9493231-Pyramimonas_sp.AAC.1
MLGHWEIGCATSPLRADLMASPAAAPELHSEMQTWLAGLLQRVPHVEGMLPKRVHYDAACDGYLCSSKLTEGTTLAESFSELHKTSDVTSAFLMKLEPAGAGPTLVRAAMVALRQHCHALSA